jgi:stress response protein YsnF
MGVQRRSSIVDADGVTGRLVRVDASQPDHPFALIELPNKARIRVPFDQLQHDADGGYMTSSRWDEFAAVSAGGVTVPVIEEKVTIDVRAAPPQSVRVRRRVVSEERVVEVPVWHERVEVERVPMDAFVERAPEPRYEGDTLVIPCIEEVPVVEVRLRVREELRVRVVREQRVRRETVTLRRHDVDVESITQTPESHRDDTGDKP